MVLSEQIMTEPWSQGTHTCAICSTGAMFLYAMHSTASTTTITATTTTTTPLPCVSPPVGCAIHPTSKYLFAVPLLAVQWITFIDGVVGSVAIINPQHNRTSIAMCSTDSRTRFVTGCLVVASVVTVVTARVPVCLSLKK